VLVRFSAAIAMPSLYGWHVRRLRRAGRRLAATPGEDAGRTTRSSVDGGYRSPGSLRGEGTMPAGVFVGSRGAAAWGAACGAAGWGGGAAATGAGSGAGAGMVAGVTAGAVGSFAARVGFGSGATAIPPGPGAGAGLPLAGKATGAAAGGVVAQS